MALERRTPILYPIGIILLIAGVISLCSGTHFSSLPESKPTGESGICIGARGATLYPGRLENIPLKTNCWSAAVTTKTGKGQIETIARDGEQYVAFCSNGNQFDARGTTIWHNQPNCPIPVFFRAVGRPFTITARPYSE